MKVRLRTNLGSHRIDCQGHWTLENLIEEIVKQLSIASGTNVVISFDLEGLNILQPLHAVVESLGLTDGVQLFLIGKFEKKVVEKSYVDVDGAVIPSGTILHRIDEDVAQANQVPMEPIGAESSEVQLQPTTSQVESTIQSSTPAAEDNNEMDIDRYFGTDYRDFEDQGFNEYEDGVRAPDVSQQMQLIEDHGLSEAIMAADQEDLLKLQKYERSLRDAGLNEYEVHERVMKKRDEMLAKRLQRELDMSEGHMTVDEMMNSLLSNWQRNTNDPSYRKRVGYTNKEWGSKYQVDGRVASSSASSSSATGRSSVKADSGPDVLRLKPEPVSSNSSSSSGGGEPSIAVAPTMTRAEKSSSNTNSSSSASNNSINSRKMRLAGLNSLPQAGSSRPTSSSSPAALFDLSEDSNASSSITKASKEYEADGPSLSLKSSGYKPISDFSTAGIAVAGSAVSSSNSGGSSRDKKDGDMHRNAKMPASHTPSIPTISLHADEDEEELKRAIAESIEESISSSKKTRKDLLVQRQQFQQQQRSNSFSSSSGGVGGGSTTSNAVTRRPSAGSPNNLTSDGSAKAVPSSKEGSTTTKPVSTKPPHAVTNRDRRGIAKAEGTRSTVKSDEQIAAELQAEEDRLLQTSLVEQQTQYQNQREVGAERAREAAQMRRYMQSGETMTSDLMGAVNDDYDQALLALVMSDSLKDSEENQNYAAGKTNVSEKRAIKPPVHHYGGVSGGGGDMNSQYNGGIRDGDIGNAMYDEEDELLARALQESLEDSLY